MAPLLQFKAGRCQRRSPDSNWVDPLPGRGLIYLEEEDGLMHFYYKDLESNAVDDLIVFPGDASFVKAAPRVHVLKFSSSSSRHFYWLQDVDESKDADNAAKVNELIGASPQDDENAMQVESSSSAAVPAAAPSTSAETTRDAAASGATTTAAVPQSGNPQQLAQLQQILAGLRSGQQAQQAPDFSLTDVLTPAAASSVVTPETTQTLLQFLPPDVPQTSESLRRALESPEFRRSVASLDRALRTGALAPLMRGLGMREEDARGVEEFIEGIKRQSRDEGGNDDDVMKED